MILDERLEFADALSVAAGFTAGAHNLGDQIPLSVARDLGGGDGGDGQLYCVIQIVTAINSATSNETVQFQLVSDATAAIDEAGAQSVHAVSKVFSHAELVAGARVVLPVPPESSQEPYELFLGVQAVVGVATLNAGVVNAFLTRDVGSNKAYSSPSQYL